MNTIYGTGSANSLYDLYTQNNTQTTDSDNYAELNRHKKYGQDSIELSQCGMETLNNFATRNTNIDNNINNSLDSLVSAGTITQDQADAVTNAFQSRTQSIQPSAVYNKRPTNPLDSLVSDGTITQDQETAIKSAFDSAMKSAKSSDTTQTDDTTKDPGTTVLDSLVSDGTITQDQETAIKDAFHSAMSSTKPIDTDQSDNTTSDNTTNDPFTDVLDSLVSAGTITQDQETSIKNAFDSAMEKIQEQISL